MVKHLYQTIMAAILVLIAGLMTLDGDPVIRLAGFLVFMIIVLTIWQGKRIRRGR